jgi:hypothetical protein
MFEGFISSLYIMIFSCMLVIRYEYVLRFVCVYFQTTLTGIQKNFCVFHMSFIIFYPKNLNHLIGKKQLYPIQFQSLLIFLDLVSSVFKIKDEKQWW